MIKIIFCGIDEFNRATFVNIEKKNKFYCDTENLFPYGATEDDMLKFYEENKKQTSCIVYKGNTFNSEPSGEDVDIELCKIEDLKQKKQLNNKMMEKKKKEKEIQKTEQNDPNTKTNKIMHMLQNCDITIIKATKMLFSDKTIEEDLKELGISL